MNIDKFKSDAHNILKELTGLVEENLKEAGDTSIESQKMWLINKINNLCYIINGTEASDLIEDTNDD